MAEQSKRSAAAVEDNARKKWDKLEYEQIAERLVSEEDEKARGGKKPFERGLLKAREYKVNIEDKLGKVVVVTKDTPLAQSGGFYCNVCDCEIKDSINFFDHINGRKHQQNLDMGMRVERATVSQVKDRIKAIKEKQIQKQNRQEIDYEAKLKAQELHKQKFKADKKKQREEERRIRQEAALAALQEAGQNEDLKEIMGFSGFKSKN